MRDATLPIRSAMVVLRPGGLSRVLLTSGLTIALLAGLAASVAVAIGMRASDPAPMAPLAAAQPVPVWLDIVKPVHIFSLEARVLAKLPSTYAARRLDIGDIREDVLGFGAWRDDQPSLRLRISRGGGDTAPPLDTTIVRQAAAVGVAIGRSKIPGILPTRFGTFEVADVTADVAIAPSSPSPSNTMATNTALQCTGFRLVVPKPALTFDGFACGSGGHPIQRRTLACLIDRLDLASVGEDRALIDFFAATDLRRSADCDGVRLAPDGVHAAWLDDKPPAPREGRSAARRRHRH